MKRIALETLVQIAKKGGENSKLILIERIRPLIITMINRYVPGNDTFEDYYMDGIEILLININTYQDDRNVPFIAYIKNQLFYHYTNQMKKKKEFVNLDAPICNGEESFKDFIEDDSPDMLTTVIAEEDNTTINNTLNNLSQKQKWIIQQYYFEGKKLKEISKESGYHYQSLVKLKKRALLSLKRELQNR